MSQSGSQQPPDTLANPTRQMLDELDALMERMLSLPVNTLEEPPPAAPLTARLTRVDPPASPPPPPAAPPPSPPRPSPPPASPSIPPSKIFVGSFSVTPSYLNPVPAEKKPPEPANKTMPGQAPVEKRDISREARPADRERSQDFQEKSALPIRDMGVGTVPTETAPRVRPMPAPEPVPSLEEIMPSLHGRPLAPDRLPAPRRRRSLVNGLLRPFLWFNQTFDRWTYGMGAPGRWLRSRGGRLILGLFGLGLLALALAWLVHDLTGWTWVMESIK